MPELDFVVTGVEPVARGLTPLLHFKLQITNASAAEPVAALLLQAQIQIASPQRFYTAPEKERLVELFGPPETWGRTLRNRLWAHSQTTLSGFTDRAETVLPVSCSFDLNLAATKYFYALEGGEVPMLFLFSGSVFYFAAEGRLQVQRISWDKECAYRMPIQLWRELMEFHFPSSSWLYLQRDVFDRLYAYKRSQGFASWEETIEGLLDHDLTEAAA